MTKIWVVQFEGEERNTYLTFDSEDDAFNEGVRFFITENLLLLDSDPEAQRQVKNFLVSDIDLALDTWNAVAFVYITVMQTVLGKLTHDQTFP